MFSFKSSRLNKLVPVLSILFMTAVILAQSGAGSALLAGIQILTYAQPHGF